MVELTRRGNDLALNGDLTVDTATRGYAQKPDFPAGSCLLDLSGIGKSDSAGLALLVYWVNLAASSGCQLRLVGAPSQMRSLMQVAALDQLLGDSAPGATPPDASR